MTTFDTLIDAIAGGPTSHSKLGEAGGAGTAADRKGVRNLTYNTGQILGATGLVAQNNASDTAMDTNNGTGNCFEASSNICPPTAWTIGGFIKPTAAAIAAVESHLCGPQNFRYSLGLKGGKWE